jgi:hypothetical protein
MMADNLSATSEREQVRGRDLNNPLRDDAPGNVSGVSVYDRPAAADPTIRPRSSNTLATILTIVLILVLVYFVLQWLF